MCEWAEGCEGSGGLFYVTHNYVYSPQPCQLRFFIVTPQVTMCYDVNFTGQAAWQPMSTLSIFTQNNAVVKKAFIRVFFQTEENSGYW